jgi:type IV pilus assembly protein PilQ
MRLGKLAILFAIAAAALYCSGNPPVSEPGQAALEVPAAVVVNAIDHTSTPSGTQVVLRGNYPFSFTTYQPDEHTLVVELLEVRAQGVAEEVRLDTPQVGGVAITNVQGVDGGTIAKFEFHNILAARHAVRLEGNDLVIDFPTLSDGENLPEPPLTATAGAAEVAHDETATADAGMAPLAEPGIGASPADAPALQPRDEPLAAEKPAKAAPKEPEVKRGPVLEGPAAANLVEVTATGGEVPRVTMRSDGALREEHFELANPPRLVVDLVGVRDRTSKKTIPVESSVLSRVRVAQFATKPQPIARVVFDLAAPGAYGIEPTTEGLMVEFSPEAAARAAAGAPDTAVAEPLAAEKPAEDGTSAEPTGAAQETLAPTDAGSAVVIRGQQVEAADTPTTDPSAPVPSEAMESNPLVAQGDVKVEPKPREVAFKPARKRPSGDVVLSMGQRPDTRMVSDNTPRYTGKRISLNFKDADLKDVFRLFHEITGFNIVLDPAVSGTLTIVLENVPEDQALDIILKNNGLDKVFDNNVIRIASTQKLAAEAAARKSLIEAQELEQEPVTFTRKLSYAKAKDAVPIIKKMMSKRGDVIMDDRTNTLIITDLASRQEPISRLIDNLDEQTPQVVIEARIVETDREFERDLGIIWGVQGTASATNGTQTGWSFPHTGTVSYDVNLPSPATAGRLGISFGNVLDSFTLDAQLDAFELNGDVKVLSSPRIATQNNQKATIEQGTQIPVVSTTATQINVEFISASLKLEVTPQITREGTVIMDLKVDNSSPDFVNRVGDVPPILTERAQTQVLVADGGTAVIGGIFKLNDSVTQAGVPGLSKIPGLGWLFRNKSINRKNTELLIFVTPRITKKAGSQEENR